LRHKHAHKHGTHKLANTPSTNRPCAMCMYVWLYLLVQCALYTYGCMVYEYCHGDNSRFNWQLSQMSVDPLTAGGLELVLGDFWGENTKN